MPIEGEIAKDHRLWGTVKSDHRATVLLEEKRELTAIGRRNSPPLWGEIVNAGEKNREFLLTTRERRRPPSKGKSGESSYIRKNTKDRKRELGV